MKHETQNRELSQMTRLYLKELMYIKFWTIYAILYMVDYEPNNYDLVYDVS